MVDNEHLKCTATLPLYIITSENAVSQTNFSAFLLPQFYEIQIFGLSCCSTREDLSIDVSITNVGLILTKLKWFLFSGYGQTDTVLESSYGNMSAHKKFQLKIRLAVNPYMPPWRTGMHNYGIIVRKPKNIQRITRLGLCKRWGGGICADRHAFYFLFKCLDFCWF